MKKITFYYHAAVSYICYSIWWRITNGGKDEKETKIRYFLLSKWYKHGRAINCVPDISE